MKLASDAIERLNTHSRWLRLLVTQAIGALARSSARPDQPVLLLEQALGLMAGYGLQLWPILSNLHQLWRIHRERTGTFLSSAGLIQVFNVGDLETASWVFRSTGSATIAYQTTSAGESKSPGRFFLTQTTTTPPLRVIWRSASC